MFWKKEINYADLENWLNDELNTIEIVLPIREVTVKINRLRQLLTNLEKQQEHPKKDLYVKKNKEYLASFEMPKTPIELKKYLKKKQLKLEKLQEDTQEAYLQTKDEYNYEEVKSKIYELEKLLIEKINNLNTEKYEKIKELKDEERKQIQKLEKLREELQELTQEKNVLIQEKSKWDEKKKQLKQTTQFKEYETLEKQLQKEDSEKEKEILQKRINNSAARLSYKEYESRIEYFEKQIKEKESEIHIKYIQIEPINPQLVKQKIRDEMKKIGERLNIK